MKISFGCDHAGFDYRDTIMEHLVRQGYQVEDCGCSSREGCDYPDEGEAVAHAVSRGNSGRGILICGTGIGMSIVANKFPGVRAAVCWNDETARLVAEHNDANILCLPGRFATLDDMLRWIDVWLKTPPSQEARHLRRREKIRDIEKKLCGGR